MPPLGGPAPSRGSNTATGAQIGGCAGLAVGIVAALSFKNQECSPPDDCGELDVYAPVVAAGITALRAGLGALIGLSLPTGDREAVEGVEPGNVTLALIASGRTIGVGGNLRF